MRLVSPLVCYIIISFLPYNSYGSSSATCVDLFYNSTTHSQDLYHNPEVAQIQRHGITTASIDELLKKLLAQQSLVIPLDSSGLAPAANVGMHHGGYGLFIWHRDFARVWQGLSALPNLIKNLSDSQPKDLNLKEHKKNAEADATSASLGLVRLLEDPQWRRAALENISNPELHKNSDSGFKSVIWIRRLLTPFRENREATNDELLMESQWGHKQNDALATLAESILDAVKAQRLSLQDFSREAQENFLFLAAYFVRIKYASMDDVGAWEENMALRTSSVGLVASFLHRVQSGLSNHARESAEELFFAGLRENILPDLHSISPELRELVQSSLSLETLSSAIADGAHLVRERTQQDRVTESASSPLRYEDSAIYHLLWSNSSVLSTSEKLKLVEGLRSLERPSGQIRYNEDWFLWGDAFRFQEAFHWQKQMLLPNESGGYHVASTEEVHKIIELHEAERFSKNMTGIIALTGPGLEAQWTLPDSYLVQFYADLYTQLGNPEHLEKAKYYYVRASRLITGPNEMNSEGHPVTEFRMPEAYIPVWVNDGGQPHLIYLASPNSPLNWSTAEFILATKKLREALELRL
jgi:hypothetical protein